MQNQSENRAYAGFFVRWMAYVIDMTLISLIVWGVKLPISLLASKGATILTKNVLFQFNIMDITGYIGVAMYFVLITYFAHTTIGKALFRLQVVCDKEWTFINILYRETIGRFLSSLMCIGYLAAAVTKKRQGFHDMLCDTYVVYKDMYVVPRVKAGQAQANTSVSGNADVYGRSVAGDVYVGGQINAQKEQSVQPEEKDESFVQPVMQSEAFAQPGVEPSEPVAQQTVEQSESSVPVAQPVVGQSELSEPVVQQVVVEPSVPVAQQVEEQGEPVQVTAQQNEETNVGAYRYYK